MYTLVGKDNRIFLCLVKCYRVFIILFRIQFCLSEKSTFLAEKNFMFIFVFFNCIFLELLGFLLNRYNWMGQIKKNNILKFFVINDIIDKFLLNIFKNFKTF